MILATHGFLASSISGIDADAQAFFDRVTTAGGSLSTTEKTAVNTLVVKMKADGIWTKMKAIYPLVGASAAACAQNLKSSSFTGTFNGGVTYSSNGILSNGTTGYMSTGIIPENDLTKSSNHISIYSRTNKTEIAFDIGSVNSTAPESGNHLTLNYGSVFYPRSFDGNLGVANTNTLGFFMANRQSSSTIKAIRNTTVNTITSNAVTSTLNTYEIILIGLNLNGTKGQFATRQYAFSSIGDGLTDTEASNLYTAVQAFQTTLSRQV